MITPPKEGKGRPSILSQPLPNDVLIALKHRSEGLSWKKAAEKAGMTYDRLRNYTRSHPQVKEVLTECNKYVKQEQTLALISTVLPGTIRRELAPLVTNTKLIYNPYLIAMGSVGWDMINPEMIIVGTMKGNLATAERAR